MAAHAREQGDEAAAKKAGTTSRFLIGLMIVTLLLVAVGVLFPAVKQYTDMAEKGLILMRVVMTVIYGHVLHALRSSHRQAVLVPATLAPQSAVPYRNNVRDRRAGEADVSTSHLLSAIGSSAARQSCFSESEYAAAPIAQAAQEDERAALAAATGTCLH